VVAVTADPHATAPSSTRSAPSGTAGAARYRCAACGNLTRFDVVTTRRTRAFHHYSVGGDLTVEEVDVLDETIEDVVCRWCGNGKAVETVETVESDPS